jgi:hypothetical protein
VATAREGEGGLKPLFQAKRDGVDVLRAVDERGTSWNYEAEWREAFKRGDVGAANMRTVSKGSSRGAGPQKKQGRVYGARRRG